MINNDVTDNNTNNQIGKIIDIIVTTVLIEVIIFITHINMMKKISYE